MIIFYKGLFVNCLNHLQIEILWASDIDFFRRRSHKKVITSSKMAKTMIKPKMDPTTITVVLRCDLESPFVISVGARVAPALAMILVTVGLGYLDSVVEPGVTVNVAVVRARSCVALPVVTTVLALLLITTLTVTLVVSRVIEVEGSESDGGSSDDGKL